jgi:hypothetical protein
MYLPLPPPDTGPVDLTSLDSKTSSTYHKLLYILKNEKREEKHNIVMYWVVTHIVIVPLYQFKWKQKGYVYV